MPGGAVLPERTRAPARVCDALQRLHLPGAGKPESVFLAGFSACPAEWNDVALAARYEKLLALRSEVTKATEEARNAGLVKKSAEARATIEGPETTLALAREAEELSTLLLVSAVVLVAGPVVRASIDRAPGAKCERCWNVRTLGEHPEHPALCARCVGAIT